MPYLGVDGALLWYDRRGAGPPVLFLTGLGGNHTLWNYQVQEMSNRFECILLDYRGVGDSVLDPDWCTTERYTLDRLAGDALALLDTLDVPHVHVVGTSMGGVVAQFLATEHPERIGSLSLHSTWARSRELARVRTESWIRLLDRLEMADFLAHLAPWIWSDRTLTTDAERIDAFRASQRKRTESVSKQIYVLQCRASIGVSTIDRLGMVSAPTLVTSGADDILLPPQESQVIHEAIEGSIFHLFAGCGHASYVEDFESFNRVQIGFLDEIERS